jgi:hypothetical protein
MIQDDDVNHKGKYFWREWNKTIFLNHIFDLYPYSFTQIQVYALFDYGVKFRIQRVLTLEISVKL